MLEVTAMNSFGKKFHHSLQYGKNVEETSLNTSETITKKVQDVVKILRFPKSFEIKMCFIIQEKDKLK